MIQNNILLTGCAGFIGFHLAKTLLTRGEKIIGIDNLNNYYDVNLKQNRINLLNDYENFKFIKTSIEDKESLKKVFNDNHISNVIHLAAQAGVRYSITNPEAYIQSNIVGFTNILESCRQNNIAHLLYASSSSVYGANVKMPFCVKDNVDHPVSLYAATKKANELMAHTYSHLYGLPTTGLRFFTVYGPWGRPDMAYFSFTKNILEGIPIKVYNNGKMKRDFTYIDDIVEGILRLIDQPPIPNNNWDRNNPDPSSSYAPYKIYNIGNNKPIELMSFIKIIEKCIGKKAIIEYLPMQAGDVEATYADIDQLILDTGFSPSTTIEQGVNNFTDWYLSYYKNLNKEVSL